MNLPKIYPGVELKASAHVLRLVDARKRIAKAGGIRFNPVNTQKKEHPEIRAYRDKISGRGRLLAQAYLKNAQAEFISPRELQSSQDIVYARTINRFLKSPEEINQPQLTRRYGTPENGFREYAIVGITSDGKKFIIDGNHRISAARKLGKKIKAKSIDLKTFLSIHEGSR